VISETKFFAIVFSGNPRMSLLSKLEWNSIFTKWDRHFL